MYKSSIELIRHIEREAAFILKTTKSKTFDEFCSDEILTRAVIRALEIVGEASKKLDTEFRSNNPQIEWKYIARMRDRLIHDYEGTDYSIVWVTIQDDIPELHFQVTEILKNTNEQ